MQARIAALVAVVMAGCGHHQYVPVISLCDLSKDFTAYRERVVAVRGVYYNGLRQRCAQTCANGPWPSFVDLVGRNASGDAIWTEVDKAQRAAEREAKQGRRVEVWATVIGVLKANDHRSPVGPCDVMVNCCYGHLGEFPAQIVVEEVSDIQVVPNTASPYDYTTIYHGAL